MATLRDPYQVLGVARDAPAEAIKRAYRRLAKELHPDLNPGRRDIEQRFKDVTAAYQLLSDPEKRGRFDRGEIDADGVERFRQAHAGAGRGPDPFAGGFDDGFFSDLFGARRRGGAGVRSRGADIAYTVSVPFLDAATGSKRRINLSTGKSIDVVIPPGTEDQQKLRLKGQGLSGLGGGEAGDAIVEVHVEPHPFFVRKGNDIHLDLPVSLPEAVLGGSVRVPTITGPVSLKVPAGSNTGSVLRLKGKGVPDQRSGQPGDQYVTLKVMLPDPPDAELTQLVERWAKDKSYDPRRRSGMS